MVICSYFLSLSRFYNTVFSGKCPWLDWVNIPLRPIMSNPHTRNECFKECLEFVSWLLNYCHGIFSRSDINIVDFAGNRGGGDWSEEVYISTLLVCLLWFDTCLQWLRNSNVYIRLGNGCHIFSISPCWCASLFQPTNALWLGGSERIFGDSSVTLAQW